MKDALYSIIETFKMMYMMNIKDSSMFDNILGLAVILFLTAMISYENTNIDSFFNILLENITFLRPRKKSVYIEGKRCLKISNYMTKTDNLFSNRFSAFWYYIAKNNLHNNSIYSICINTRSSSYNSPHKIFFF